MIRIRILNESSNCASRPTYLPTKSMVQSCDETPPDLSADYPLSCSYVRTIHPLDTVLIQSSTCSHNGLATCATLHCKTRATETSVHNQNHMLLAPRYPRSRNHLRGVPCGTRHAPPCRYVQKPLSGFRTAINPEVKFDRNTTRTK